MDKVVIYHRRTSRHNWLALTGRRRSEVTDEQIEQFSGRSGGVYRRGGHSVQSPQERSAGQSPLQLGPSGPVHQS